MATKYNLSSYNYEDLRQMDVKDLRREYSRLRDVAHKRLQRLSASDFSETQTYLRYRNKFVGLKEIKKGQVSKLSKKLSELHTFLEMETSTISGSKSVAARIIKGLQDNGYDYIKTEKDLRTFGEYMDFNRALKKGGKYDSEKVMQMTEEMEKVGVSPKDVEKDFKFWIKNYKDIEKMKEKVSTSNKEGSRRWLKELKSLL